MITIIVRLYFCKLDCAVWSWIFTVWCKIKGGPEPLENEINEILGSKSEDRFSTPFFGTFGNFRRVHGNFRSVHFRELSQNFRELSQCPRALTKITVPKQVRKTNLTRFWYQWFEDRSSRFEPKISLISFSRGSGPPLTILVDNTVKTRPRTRSAVARNKPPTNEIGSWTK